MAAVTGRMPAPAPWRLRRRAVRSAGLSTQRSAQKQRLRAVGVTETQLREGAALLAAVQAQLNSSYSHTGQPRRDGVQAADVRQTDRGHQAGPQTIDPRRPDPQRTDFKQAAGAQTAGSQRANHLGPTPGKARSRKPSRAAPVDTGSIRAESWPFFEVPASSDAVDASISPEDEDARAVPTVGADGWPTGFGMGSMHGESTAGNSTRRPTSVSGTRPSSFGGSNFGRPSTSDGAARPSARLFASEGAARPSARPSTSEGCRTFGRPPEGSRVRGSSPGRPVTVDGTRPHRGSSADGWSGHGDGASWFRAEQETARREQAASREAEDRWRAHFDSQCPAPRQDSWERRQARRRAANERSEQRASQFRAQKVREKEVTRQLNAMVRITGPFDSRHSPHQTHGTANMFEIMRASMQDDIWSEAESDLQARARRHAQAQAKAAKQKADAEQAVGEMTSDQALHGPPERADARPPADDEGPVGSRCSEAADVEVDQTSYDDDELLDAWDAVCGGQRELDVHQVGELLVQLGKPVGCYELQYIVSKIGDQVTGRISLPAFRKWWDDVLREFAEWCVTHPARASSPAAQAVDGSSGARKWQTHSSTRSSGPKPTAAGGCASASGVGEHNGTGHTCGDGRSLEEGTESAGAAAAGPHLRPEELAASAEQEVEAARAAAVAQSHAEAQGLRWTRHIAEKQRTRVLAHRGQQKALEEEAAAKRELVVHITDRLARQVRGKSFVSVLQELGVSVTQGEAAQGADVHKAYRRALSVYHPDRATRRGLSWQKVTEAEETYKMLQILYERYVAHRQSKQKQNQGQRRRQ